MERKTGGWLDLEADIKSPKELTVPEKKVLRTIADKITKRKLETPAILFLESIKPLNFIGSQVLLFLEPYLTLFSNKREISDFRRAMGKRQGIEVLITYIEKLSQGKEIDIEEMPKEEAIDE